MNQIQTTKLVLKNPLLSLLQYSKSVSEILQIHAQMIITNLMSDGFAVSRLISAYSLSKNSNMGYAELVVSNVQKSNTFMWNTIIRGNAESSNPTKAIISYAKMRENGVPMDKYTYPSVLKACSLTMRLKEGRESHGDILKRGFKHDLFVRNSLINMYCKCGFPCLGRKVFDEITERDLVTWSSMIAGYVGCGEMKEAQKLFDEMPQRDLFSLSTMINGYAKKTGDVHLARRLFDDVLIKDIACWNSMIDGYVSLGDMVSARELFEKMSQRNLVSWSIMIDGYSRHGEPKEALNLFSQMIVDGIKPDKISLVGAITACTQLGSLDQGRWIHMYIEKNKIFLDVVTQTALIDMYLKCGCLKIARYLFKNMPAKNVISYNVMIIGLGINGCGKEAIELFFQMEKEGILMDDLSFLGILTACSHAGLVEEGLQIFKRMKTNFIVEPKVEHYNCMVDLLGRAGFLQEARRLIEEMPDKANSALWGSLLAACRLHGCIDLALEVMKHLDGYDEDGVYVLMSNIYANEGMWDNVMRTRKMMNGKGVKKETGKSVIEVDGVLHEFVNGDQSHCQVKELSFVILNLYRASIWC